MTQADRVPVPQLLVSVRSAGEARAALDGGCDILDVKEPARGPLGMADPETIADVVTAAHPRSGGFQPPRVTRETPEAVPADVARGRIPVTAALGETRDWLSSDATPRIPPGVALVKLGLAGSTGPRWRHHWNDLRRRTEQMNERPLRWIAVAYADWRTADAPPPDAVIAAAISGGCAGVLFDTYIKDGRNLLQHVDPQQIGKFTETIQRAGLLTALAGSLAGEHLPLLRNCRSQVIAIRGAACLGGNRSGEVSAAAVAAFRSTLCATWNDSAPARPSLRRHRPDSGRIGPG